VSPALVYLHGFASGPHGSKGEHCRRWAGARGIPFHAPDLNLPDFEHLTLSAQVAAVEALLATRAEPPVLVGSSLGGLIGAAVAQRGTPLAHLILLAPAFGFARRRLTLGRWGGYRKRGSMKVFHHALGEWRTLGPELLADLPAWRDDDQWQLPVPLTILHGCLDEAVPLAESTAFARRHPGARLCVLEDDHGLLATDTLAELDARLQAAFPGVQGLTPELN
jgi:pimeloyl-ACP methyl ester carboxylesterase